MLFRPDCDSLFFYKNRLKSPNLLIYAEKVVGCDSQYDFLENEPIFQTSKQFLVFSA